MGGTTQIGVLCDSSEGKSKTNSICALGGVELYLHSFLTSVIDGGILVASQRNHISRSHWSGEWLGPRDVWTLWRREKDLSPPSHC
jgi:hypothetical protein